MGFSDMIRNTVVRLFGREIIGIETKFGEMQGGHGRERGAPKPKEIPPINPDLLKPVARESVAFLENFARATVQSDPTFDESVATEIDASTACEELAKTFTPKGVENLTYHFLLLGPLSEQKDLVPFFQGAVRIVVEKSWPKETAVIK